MLIQPFVNYNLPDAWYVTSAPITCANVARPDTAAERQLRIQIQLLFPKCRLVTQPQSPSVCARAGS